MTEIPQAQPTVQDNIAQIVKLLRKQAQDNLSFADFFESLKLTSKPEVPNE